MDPNSRSLIRVMLDHDGENDNLEQTNTIGLLVENLMGKNPEMRFKFIQENANIIKEFDI